MDQSDLQKNLGARLETAQHRLRQASAEVALFTRQIAELEVALRAISTISEPKKRPGRLSLGDKALTGAERAKAARDRKKERGE
jgi:hypothetical protein